MLSDHAQQSLKANEEMKEMLRVGLKFECTKYIYEGNPNGWHIARLTTEDFVTFKWTNKAGASWTLTQSASDKRGQPTQFNVGTDCQYYFDGYKMATVNYGPNGNLLSISGPWNEIYNHVIDWTLANNEKLKISMPNVWKIGLYFECSQYIKAGNPND